VIARILLGLVGVAMASYGGWLLLAEDLADLVETAIWLAAGVVLHDFVLVPLTLALGYAATRLLPAGGRAPVAAGLVVLGTLTLMAVPVLGRFGERSDNPTILDRDYTTGWLVLAGVVTVVVLLATMRQAIGRAGPGKGSGVVERRRRRPR
jgi:EamA domain-containing membrane protein RarD